MVCGRFAQILCFRLIIDEWTTRRNFQIWKSYVTSDKGVIASYHYQITERNSWALSIKLKQPIPKIYESSPRDIPVSISLEEMRRLSSGSGFRTTCRAWIVSTIDQREEIVPTQHIFRSFKRVYIWVNIWSFHS
jgi:hypothetical protein